MRRSIGLRFLVAFFIFGSGMATLAFLGLLLPAGHLEPMWRFKRQAQVGLLELGWWGLLLKLIVAIACASAPIGLSRRARWG
jgi:hypothetical protein